MEKVAIAVVSDKSAMRLLPSSELSVRMGASAKNAVIT
jgi:hypothetical protein